MRLIVIFCLTVVWLFLPQATAYANGAVSGSFTLVDGFPPAAVTNLSVVARTIDSLTLSWTAPGNNGNAGIATEYDIRYSGSPISNEDDWNASTLVVCGLTPKPPGSTETFTVTSLVSYTNYWFALKTADGVPNWSDLSNTVKDKTRRTHGSVGIGGIPFDEYSSPEPEPLILEVDIWGRVFSGYRAEDGILIETIEVVSPDGMPILLLQQGTKVLDNEGNPIDLLKVRSVAPSGIPAGKLLIGPGYELQPSCTFEPPVQFILHYDPDSLGDGISVEDLLIACYDEEQQRWLEMPTIIDVEAHTATALLSRPSIIAMLVEAPTIPEPPPLSKSLTMTEPPTLPEPPMPSEPPSVAELPSFSAGVSNLGITPSQEWFWEPIPFAIRNGEEVMITAYVSNRGNQEGSFDVIFQLNDRTKATQKITLGPEQSEQVLFLLSDVEPGHHSVTVNGISGEIISSLRINWWFIVCIVDVLAVIGSVAAWLYMRKPRHKGI